MGRTTGSTRKPGDSGNARRPRGAGARRHRIRSALPAPILAALALPLVASCTAGVGTRIDEPIRPAAPLELPALAVLPVLTAPGWEGVRPLVESTLVDSLALPRPELALVAPGDARRLLGARDQGATLAALVRDYRDSGVADLSQVAAVSDALGHDHFLHVEVGLAESEVLKRDPLADEAYNEDRREMYVVARLWSRGESAPLWEGSVRADSETGFLSSALPGEEEMIRGVVGRLVSRIPLAGASPGTGTRAGS